MKLKKVSRAIIKLLVAVSGLVELTWWMVIMYKDKMCELPTTGVQVMVWTFALCVWCFLMIQWLESEFDY